MEQAHLSKTEVSSTNDDDDGPTDGDPPPITFNRGSIIVERMDELVLRYSVPSNYVCRVPTINKYISTRGSLEISVYEETFLAGFQIPIHPFVEELLRRYRLVPAQIHPNTWWAIYNFMIKCTEVRRKPQMKALRSVLSLKWVLSVRNIVYASYKKTALAPLLPDTLHWW